MLDESIFILLGRITFEFYETSCRKRKTEISGLAFASTSPTTKLLLSARLYTLAED